MAIDSLGSSYALNYSQYSTSSSIVNPAQDSGSTQPASGGGFATAIEATLAQLSGGSASGTSADSSASSSSSQDPSQAEQAFAQSLFSALQSQFGGQQQNSTTNATGTQSTSGANGASGHHHHHHGGGGGRLASALDSLSQQLGSSSDSTDSSASDLQTSFNNLLTATGQSGSSATLPQFLQSLAQNLQNGSSSGNLLNVQV